MIYLSGEKEEEKKTSTSKVDQSTTLMETDIIYPDRVP